MTALPKFTPLQINPTEENMLNSQVVERLKINIHNEIYMRLDLLLLQLVGSEMSMIEILAYLKAQDPIAYSKLSCIALD
jgi:hypothetical protein